MKVGDKIVIRLTAQTWAQLAPLAKHWTPVIENTETKDEVLLPTVDTADEAFILNLQYYLDNYDRRKFIAVVGTSQTDMCQEWI